jgi:hypothetical protein
VIVGGAGAEGDTRDVYEEGCPLVDPFREARGGDRAESSGMVCETKECQSAEPANYRVDGSRRGAWQMSFKVVSKDRRREYESALSSFIDHPGPGENGSCTVS